MTPGWHDDLARLSACREAVEWASGYATLSEAWATCQRGDWMLWLAGRVAGAPWSDARRTLVLAAADCAELSPDIPAAGIAAIAAARRWANGQGTIEGVGAAAYAAYAVAYAAAAAAAAAVAYAVADAAAAIAASAARSNMLKPCADIVRAHYPEPPRIGDAADAIGGAS